MTILDGLGNIARIIAWVILAPLMVGFIIFEVRSWFMKKRKDGRKGGC
jgi:hypothetical protein